MSSAPPRIQSTPAAPPPRLTPLHNGWWAGAYQTAVTRTQKWLDLQYQRAATVRLGPLHGGDALQFLSLNLLLCLPYLIFEKYRAFVFKILSIVFPSLSEFGHVSADALSLSRSYPLLHIVFVFACLVPKRLYLRVLPPALLVVGVVGRLFDLSSVLAVAALAAFVFLIAKARRPSRPWKLVIVCLGYLVFMSVCQFADCFPAWMRWPPACTTDLARFAAFGPGFVPLLWYATYEVNAGRLRLPHCGTYLLLTRLFGGPVLRPSNPLADWEQKCVWQWRGVFTLATAMIALGAGGLLERHLLAYEAVWRSAQGGRLALYSYCHYLQNCLALVAGFNVFVGWARLFGVPIQNVFFFWLLARTPNERWRRWNMPFREWIITYVFYPMMRANKGLFLCVMATLLCSGVIHIVHLLTPTRFDPAYIARILGYWTFSGVAIYVVIVFPRAFPALLVRLHMRENVAWSVVGIAATSLTYSVAMVLRDKCPSWSDALSYLARLLQV